MWRCVGPGTSGTVPPQPMHGLRAAGSGRDTVASWSLSLLTVPSPLAVASSAHPAAPRVGPVQEQLLAAGPVATLQTRPSAGFDEQHQRLQRSYFLALDTRAGQQRDPPPPMVGQHPQAVHPVGQQIVDRSATRVVITDSIGEPTPQGEACRAGVEQPLGVHQWAAQHQVGGAHRLPAARHAGGLIRW